MNRYFILLLCVLALSLVGCQSPKSVDSTTPGASSSEKQTGSDEQEQASAQKTPETIEALPEQPADDALEIATFAGGCFWCMEPPFDELDGVESTISGYTGGDEEHPTYLQVSSGQTGHAEAVRVYYDPDKVSYKELLEVFWRNIDPTQKNGQFVDRGSQYRSAIYYHDAGQRELAEQTRGELERSGPFDEPIVTEIEPAQTFWKAEEYHQDFYKKDPKRYKSYRRGSGRDQFIERVWGED